MNSDPNIAFADGSYPRISWIWHPFFAVLGIFLPAAAPALPSSFPVTTACECEATTASRAIQVTSATSTFSAGTLGQLERVVARHRGRMGLSVRNLDTGETLEVNGQTAFPTASTIKVAVMAAALDRLGQQGSELQDYYQTKVYDAASSVSGTGWIQNYRDGVKVEFKEMLHLMITVSDNVATNMITEWLGGPGAVNHWLQSRGFKVHRMNATIGGRLIDDPQLRQEWGIGVTTPCEMRRLMEMIALGQAGPTTATEEMLRILGKQYWDDLILGEVPPMVWAGGKSGALSRSRSDTAIVASPGGRYVIAVYTSENEDTRWTGDNEAEAAIRNVSRIIWRHFNPSSTYERPAGMDKF